MSIELKEQSLLKLLSPNKTTAIKFIAKKLFVSEPTARRYVNKLAKKGIVIRTHGGCMPSATVFDNNTPIYIRYASETNEKKLIAKKATELIKDNMTVFLDSSSTTFEMVPFIRLKNNITVITSSIKTAMALSELNVKTACLGGFINTHNLSLNSSTALSIISDFNADIFFFSCDGLSSNGELTDNSYEESILRKEFMKYSKLKVLLIDNTKLNKKFKYNLSSLKNINMCISNNQNDVILLK